ncbi:hypothetical protein LTS18_006446, partial [Coniosporium uncinatum]
MSPRPPSNVKIYFASPEPSASATTPVELNNAPSPAATSSDPELINAVAHLSPMQYNQ